MPAEADVGTAAFHPRVEDERAQGLHRELEPELLRAASAGRSGGGYGEASGFAYYLKYSPLRGRARARHALRLAMGLELPRMRELSNLQWLRRQGLGAPRPLFAGSLGPRRAPRFQYLATERVPDARTLRELLTDAAVPSPTRARALERLARDTARLHGLGFVHRDLFPRNLLVTDEDTEPQVHFLDAWRGGPGNHTALGARGPAYDLGCLFVFASELLDEREQRLFLGTYARERALTNAAAKRLFERAARHRAHVAARSIRRGRRDPPVPSEPWTPPTLPATVSIGGNRRDLRQ